MYKRFMKKKSSNLVKQKPCQMTLRSKYRNSKLQKSYGEIIEDLMKYH